MTGTVAEALKHAPTFRKPWKRQAGRGQVPGAARLEDSGERPGLDRRRHLEKEEKEGN